VSGLNGLLLYIRGVHSAFRVVIVLFAHHCKRVRRKYVGAVFPTDVRCVVFLFSCDKS
jgi:hypothetical protein